MTVERQSLIQKKWQADSCKYITGIMKNRDHKPLQIGGMPDHIHTFLGCVRRSPFQSSCKPSKESFLDEDQ
ncbi:MAG: hypothetical protein GVY26_20530 [Bacteroidetes bacterium]|nr:hypothetical protein [Bacteroidota bacterium]